ncbi:MAG: T9SS type A sorting domain-containing protein [Chitinophagaceae bacterium]|nr:T9SS type A sorting domain-containing protein [Chitinophagaceae bacterium]
MKNKFKKIILFAVGYFALSAAFAQNVSVNMLVLNSGAIPLGGNGTLKATINATPGTAGQSTPVPTGKVNLSVTVPPSLLISATQNNIPTGWTVRNNDGSVINLCNNSTTIAVNTAIDLLIDLQGITVTSGAPTMSGQLTFKTNCTAPGSLSGDNPSDNSSQAGYFVSNTTPITLFNFTAALVNCQPSLKWITENEINSDRFEIERRNQNASDWELVGDIAASGNSAVKVIYSYTDNNVPAVSEKLLYRLKMIDQNGRYKYSEVLPVFINCKTTQLHIYPNPVQNGYLNVSLTGNNENADAALVSPSGQVILKMNLNRGSNTLYVGNIASGVYVLNVNFKDGNSKKIKVVIEN